MALLTKSTHKYTEKPAEAKYLGGFSFVQTSANVAITV